MVLSREDLHRRALRLEWLTTAWNVLEAAVALTAGVISGSVALIGFGIDSRVRDLDYAALRRFIDQWRQINANYYGDFYPLTPWTRDDTAWMAWQFDRPATGEGLIQVFRRHNSFYESARLRLKGVDENTNYLLTSLDTGGFETRPYSGRELRNDGLPIAIVEKPGVATVVYRRQQ